MKRLILFAIVVAAISSLAPAHAARDRTRPRITYTTSNPAVVISNPANQSSDDLPLEILGRATDDVRIKRVEAVWVPCTTSSAESCTFLGVDTILHDAGPVTTTCNATRRACVWRAPAPTAPGSYWFAATAVDGAGNESRRSGILQVTVV